MLRVRVAMKVYTGGSSDRLMLPVQVRVGEDARWLYGRYVCVAKNQHGHAERTFKLIQAGTLITFSIFLL